MEADKLQGAGVFWSTHSAKVQNLRQFVLAASPLGRFPEVEIEFFRSSVYNLEEAPIFKVDCLQCVSY